MSNAWKHLTEYGDNVDVYERVYTPEAHRGLAPIVSAQITRAEGQVWWRIYVPGYDRFGVTQINIARGVLADIPGAVAVAKGLATRAGNKAVAWEYHCAEAKALADLNAAIERAEAAQGHLKMSERRRIAWEADVARSRWDRFMALAA